MTEQEQAEEKHRQDWIEAEYETMGWDKPTRVEEIIRLEEEMDLFFSISAKLGKERARVLEEHIKLHIQPKPKWLPQFVWHKILRRLWVLELIEKR